MNRIFQLLNRNLIVPLLLAGIVPLLVVSAVTLLRGGAALEESSASARVALEERVQSSLESIRDDRKIAIERYFQSISSQVITFSSSPTVVEAMEDFGKDFKSYRKVSGIDSARTLEQRRDLQNYYSGEFDAEYRNQNGGAPSNALRALSQLSPTAVALQHAYIRENPSPLGSKQLMTRADGNSDYHQHHEGFHPWARSYLERFGYYDIFLIDAETGEIVYSVFKELDYGTSLLEGPYASTNFAEAFKQAASAASADFFVVEDFQPYPPSYEAAASFIASPIHNGSETVGVAVFQMPLDRITEVMSSRSGLGETGETILVGSNHLMRSDSFRDPERRSVVASFRNPEDGSVKTSAVDSALAGASGIETLVSYHGSEVLSAYAPVDIHGNRWAILTEVETAEAFSAVALLAEEAAKTRQSLLIWTGVVLLLASGLIVFFGRGITRSLKQPINEMLRSIESAAGGNLVDPPRVESQDEIGRMAIRFGDFLDGLRENLREIKTQGSELNEASSSLSAVASDMAGEISLMNGQANAVAGTADQMTTNMSTVAGSVEQSTANIRNVAAAVEEMSCNLTSVSQNVDGMAQNVNAVATRVEDMSASLAKVSESSEQAAGIATRAASEAKNTNDTVRLLGESAQEIGKVVGVINDIAEQTNLLALNATIEAASAGDAGRGFAVVANEVKELAKQTASATDEIRNKIEDMQESTRSAVTAIQEIVGIIDEINGISQEIATSVADQRNGAADIASAVADAAEAARLVNDAVRDCSQGATEVAQNAEELSAGSNEIAQSASDASEGANDVTSNMKQVSASVQHTAEGAGRVEDSAKQLTTMATRLRELVAQFQL